MNDKKKDYTVLEQFVYEAAQLLGKKLVDQEGGNEDDDGNVGSPKAVDEGNGNVSGNDSGGESGGGTNPEPEKATEAKTETAPAETEESGEDSIELDTLDKPGLVTLATKYGIPFEQKWTADKLRQVIAKAMGAALEDGSEAPAAKPKNKKSGKPKVGDTILVNEDNNVWNPYEVTAVRGNGIFTKKWQLTVDDEGTDWKYPE